MHLEPVGEKRVKNVVFTLQKMSKSKQHFFSIFFFLLDPEAISRRLACGQDKTASHILQDRTLLQRVMDYRTRWSYTLRQKLHRQL